jgi:hypothetical protein
MSLTWIRSSTVQRCTRSSVRLLYDSGEMPYGVMKARDGDPDVWIADRLYELGLIKEEQNDPNGLPLNFTNRYHQEEEA